MDESELRRRLPQVTGHNWAPPTPSVPVTLQGGYPGDHDSSESTGYKLIANDDGLHRRSIVPGRYCLNRSMIP